MKIIKIESKIYEIRGQKIMLVPNSSGDLALMYEVETRALKQAVKRNMDPFPLDFMFQLTAPEVQKVLSQNVISSISYLGGALPFAFAEQGVAMLSSVLKSKKALQVNIAIMRAFVFVRKFALSHKELTAKLKLLESKYDRQFRDVFEARDYLLKKDKQKEVKLEVQKNRRKIGF